MNKARTNETQDIFLHQMLAADGSAGIVSVSISFLQEEPPGLLHLPGWFTFRSFNHDYSSEFSGRCLIGSYIIGALRRCDPICTILPVFWTALSATRASAIVSANGFST
jgi:hypothetical protein